MYARSLLTFVLLAFCALSTVLASPPPHPSTNILSVTSPTFDSVYHVGQDVHVKISIVNGTAGALYKANPKVNILLQKNIRLPLLNVQVGSISARTLYHDGFKFKVDKKYLIKEQANVPFRVRTSFDLGTLGGFADSPSFKLVK
ncbi:hypothetical protein EDD21DRAFT_373908 [Dissophora ornata]|nr:hypothetical protein BGZ58_006790 [Dissophora ornata]KAI8601676.1 hypothetical protein EDD21DRAFT_373908 [Dissophora ornata]